MCGARSVMGSEVGVRSTTGGGRSMPRRSPEISSELCPPERPDRQASVLTLTRVRSGTPSPGQRTSLAPRTPLSRRLLKTRSNRIWPGAHLNRCRRRCFHGDVYSRLSVSAFRTPACTPIGRVLALINARAVYIVFLLSR